MTQQTQVTAPSVSTVQLPFELQAALLADAEALKALNQITGGTLSGVDTQVERTDLIKQVRSYFESGTINVGGLIIGVLFLIAGVYLLFLEFKESPKSKDVGRVSRDVSSRVSSGRKSKKSKLMNEEKQDRRKTREYVRQSREDQAYKTQHAKNLTA